MASLPHPTAAIDKHRLAGLQDGVYSIAMTLLVLELKLPALPDPVTDAALWSALAALWPLLLTWLLSFWVLAVFWIGDARALGVTTTVDGMLLRLGLLRLALVSLLPFSTGLIGAHGDHAAGSMVYAAHLCVLAGTQAARSLYLRAHPPLAAWPDADAARDAVAQAVVTLACTAAAFGLAFLVPGYNMFALLPMLFLQRLRRHRISR
ncbi:MAG: DUF1211 domain-containing protein [Burkholderiales bacterium]|nr:DUF1211 domain-containing protein [Burkholderiales bacterium]